MPSQPTIFVVDDDPAVSRAIASAGQLLGVPLASFASAREFRQAYDPSQPGCLVLDIKMPGTSGLELQREFARQGSELPMIMISGHADVRIAVEVMAHGALTLLEKPFQLDELLNHIRRALDLDAARRAAQARRAEVEAQFAQLTPREREVLELISAGKSNKQIAAHLGLSVRAVEDRRARLCSKLQVRSVAELVLLAAQAKRVAS